MRIVNAQLFNPESGCRPGAVEIEKGKITRVDYTPPAHATLQEGDFDAGGMILSPGWIELQINGGFGHDFTSEPASIWEVAAQLPRYGVCAFLPTIISAVYETYLEAIAILRQGPPPGWRGAQPLGLHFEGPFFNMTKKGAHNPDLIRNPDPVFAREWSRANGVLLVTMAPEQPGGLNLAAQLVSRGVILSAGHSMATLEDASWAIKAGFSMATHLFNAMPALDHRAPGLAAAALCDSRLTPSLIADGIHVHPQMIDLAWRLKGANGIALITDAVGALGFAPGEYIQGGMEIVVNQKAAYLKNGTLAGSILSLDQALRNVMAFTGSSLIDVLPALSATQARLLGCPDLGAIRPGCRANFTLLDEEGFVKATFVDGEKV